MSHTMIYYNATRQEKTEVEAKIANVCVNILAVTILILFKLTLFLAHLKALLLPIQPPCFQGAVCVLPFRLERFLQRRSNKPV